MHTPPRQLASMHSPLCKRLHGVLQPVEQRGTLELLSRCLHMALKELARLSKSALVLATVVAGKGTRTISVPSPPSCLFTRCRVPESVPTQMVDWESEVRALHSQLPCQTWITSCLEGGRAS